MVGVLCAAQFLVIMNAPIVTVALPSIQRDLEFSTSMLTWVVSTFVLVFGGFLLLGGRSGDLLGRKRALILGVSIFLLASLACGLATEQWMLILGRALQGLGAAIVVPVTLSILTTSFPDGPKRRRALALWGGFSSVAAGSAMVLGGVLTEHFSWSAIFFINVPLGIVVIVVAVRYVPASARPTDRKTDVGGAITITGTAVALVYAMISGRQDGWLTMHTLGALLVAIILSAVFFFFERMNPRPLVRLSLFRVRTFALAILILFSVAGAVMTTNYMIALYLQHTLRLSALETGLIFLPITLAVFGGSLIAHLLIGRLGFSAVLVISLTLMGVGAALMTGIDVGDSSSEILPPMTVMYFGAGCAGVTATVLAATRIAESDSGLVAGLINASQQLGAALWLAVFASIATVAQGEAAGGGELDTPQLTSFYHAILGVAVLIVVTALAIPAMLLRRRKLAVDDSDGHEAGVR